MLTGDRLWFAISAGCPDYVLLVGPGHRRLEPLPQGRPGGIRMARANSFSRSLLKTDVNLERAFFWFAGEWETNAIRESSRRTVAFVIR